MKVTFSNKEIVTLVNAGVLMSTAHSLSGKERYAAYTLRKSLYDAYSEYLRNRADLLAECGLDDKSIRRREQLTTIRRTEDENRELSELDAKMREASTVLAALLEEEKELSVIPICYDAFCSLQDENRSVTAGEQQGGTSVTLDVFSRTVEIILQGKFWVKPSDTDDNDVLP